MATLDVAARVLTAVGAPRSLTGALRLAGLPTAHRDRPPQFGGPSIFSLLPGGLGLSADRSPACRCVCVAGSPLARVDFEVRLNLPLRANTPGFGKGFTISIAKIGHLEDARPRLRNYRPYRKTTAEDRDE